MKPHLPFSLFLSVASLCAVACAESVSVGSWEEVSSALANGNQEMTLTGDIVTGSSTLKPGTATVIDGNGHSFIITPVADGQTTSPMFDLRKGGSLTWENVSVTGTVNPNNEIGRLRGELIAMGTTASTVSINNSSISGIKVGNDVSNSLFYLAGNRNSTASVSNSSFKNNAITSIRLGCFEGSGLNNCTFEGNGSAISREGGALYLEATGLWVKNTTFTGNYVQEGSDVAAKGGAIYAGNGFNLESCDFRGNYVVSGNSSSGQSTGKGGAIYLTEMDNRNLTFNLVARDKDCVFEGNRMGVTSVGADGKLEGGVANSIYVDDVYNRTGQSTFSILADEGKSVKFYDPIVVNDVNLGTIETSTPIKANQIGVMKLNAYSPYWAPYGNGSIVFSGEKYTTDADRMSRLTMAMMMAQDNGKVIITKGACVGANMTSKTIADAKTERIENAGYNLRKGTLSITENGSLIAGGFMVGDSTVASGKNGCTLSVGSGANLTTGWVRIDQGVSFDLLSFYKGGAMGLKIDLASNYLTFDSVTDFNYDSFAQSATGRFVLGGTLGLADSLNMYKDEKWKTNQSFLLLDLSKSAADAYKESGSTNFGEIVSNTTGSARVDDSSVYNGTWGQQWVDDGKGGKQLYAVWKADGNTPSIPEPSTATLSLAGLALLVLRRRR